MVPLTITSCRIPTPQPSPSVSPVKSSPTRKKGKQDKGKGKELKESKEEGRGGRRRLGRLEKSNAKRKFKGGASQVVETD